MVDYFVIRRLIYLRPDELALLAGSGGVAAIFQDRSLAEGKFRELELRAFRGLSFPVLEELIRDHGGGYGRCCDLAEYCRRKLGMNILSAGPARENGEASRRLLTGESRLLQGLSDPDLWQIRKLSGVSFYELFNYRGRQSEWEDFARLLTLDLPDPNEEEEKDPYADLYS